MLFKRPTAQRTLIGALVGLALMAFGAQSSFAADYQDAKSNVCEGNKPFEETKGCPQWGTHVTGGGNVALGPEMMSSLTTGNSNVAFAFGALASDTEGSGNFAGGDGALKTNTVGVGNIAIGENALLENVSGNSNTALGEAAMEDNTTGHDNFANGFEALFHNSTGEYNVANGLKALFHNTTGFDNLAFGAEALFSNGTGHRNLASGFEALFANTTGNENVADGVLALAGNKTGSANVALGTSAGKNLTTGSHNVDISNEGVAGEEGTTRIGTEKVQTKVFMAGIFPATVEGCVVSVNEEGQLGCNPFVGKEGKEGAPGKEGKEGSPGKEGKTGAPGPAGPAGNAAIANFSSTQNVASGQCLNYSEDEAGGSCPKKATSFPTSNLLTGPIPANGSTVTNLYAETNATVKGSDTASVEAIDNTTGVALLSCAVNSTTKNHCSNTGSSAPVAAGDKIEVKVTANGPSGNSKQWQVTFRY